MLRLPVHGLLTSGLAIVVAATGPVSGDLVDFVITLDGTQESPAVSTPASGSGTATLDTETGLLSWSVVFVGLGSPQTGAHFHGPASLCENAGIQIVLPAGSPIVGSAKITPEQAAEVLAGLWYVNVHSMVHPSGEIRGQVQPAPIEDPLPDIVAGGVHIALETVADGLTSPNWGTFAPGDPFRLFVADQSGTLWAINLQSGDKSVFLDVSARLVDLGVFGEGSFDERGFLGLAFHPEYARNGLLYTYTSEPLDGAADFSSMPEGVLANHQAVITEWTVRLPGDPGAVADPSSAREVLRVDEPQFNHNAGAIVFGPDGFLYIALGDGGGADDQDGQGFIGGTIIGHGCIGNGQDRSNPLGSVLRIDPAGTNAANGAYGVPADNPFVGERGVVEEIYAYGLRNPFRISFDMLTGDLYIADVGQNDIEELHVGAPGANYGWNNSEGSFKFVPNGAQGGYVALAGPAEGGTAAPVAEYDHDDGISIIGGFVYRGTKIEPLIGKYVFGDWSLGFLANNGRLFHLDGGSVLELQLDGAENLGMSLQGFGQDALGNVYVLANTTGTPFGDTGVVLRIVRRPGDVDANGIVDVQDLSAVILGWGRCPAAPSACPGDLDGNGLVNVTDLVEVILNWG